MAAVRALLFVMIFIAFARTSFAQLASGDIGVIFGSELRNRILREVLVTQGDAITEMIQKRVGALNDPKKPYVFTYKFDTQVLASTFRDHHFNFMGFINSLSEDPAVRERLVKDWERLYDSWSRLKVHGEMKVKVFPRIEEGHVSFKFPQKLGIEEVDAEPLVDQVFKPSNAADDLWRSLTQPILPAQTPGITPLTKASFEITSNPHIEISEVQLSIVDPSTKQTLPLHLATPLEIPPIEFSSPLKIKYGTSVVADQNQRRDKVKFDPIVWALKSQLSPAETEAAMTYLKSPEYSTEWTRAVQKLPVEPSAEDGYFQLYYVVMRDKEGVQKNILLQKTPEAKKRVDALGESVLYLGLVHAKVSSERSALDISVDYLRTNFWGLRVDPETVQNIVGQIASNNTFDAVVNTALKPADSTTPNNKQFKFTLLDKTVEKFNRELIPLIRERFKNEAASILVYIYKDEKNSVQYGFGNIQDKTTLLGPLKDAKKLIFAGEIKIPLEFSSGSVQVSGNGKPEISGEITIPKTVTSTLIPLEFYGDFSSMSPELKAVLAPFERMSSFSNGVQLKLELENSLAAIKGKIPVQFVDGAIQFDTRGLELDVKSLSTFQTKNLQLSDSKGTVVNLDIRRDDLFQQLTPQIDELLSIVRSAGGQRAYLGALTSLEVAIPQAFEKQMQQLGNNPTKFGFPEWYHIRRRDKVVNGVNRYFDAQMKIKTFDMGPRPIDFHLDLDGTSLALRNIDWDEVTNPIPESYFPLDAYRFKGPNGEFKSLLELPGQHKFDFAMTIPKKIEIDLADIDSDEVRISAGPKSPAITLVLTPKPGSEKRQILMRSRLVNDDRSRAVFLIPERANLEGVLAAYDLQVVVHGRAEIHGKSKKGKAADIVQTGVSALKWAMNMNPSTTVLKGKEAEEVGKKILEQFHRTPELAKLLLEQILSAANGAPESIAMQRFNLSRDPALAEVKMPSLWSFKPLIATEPPPPDPKAYTAYGPLFRLGETVETQVAPRLRISPEQARDVGTLASTKANDFVRGVLENGMSAGTTGEFSLPNNTTLRTQAASVRGKLETLIETIPKKAEPAAQEQLLQYGRARGLDPLVASLNDGLNKFLDMEKQLPPELLHGFDAGAFTSGCITTAMQNDVMAIFLSAEGTNKAGGDLAPELVDLVQDSSDLHLMVSIDFINRKLAEPEGRAWMEGVIEDIVREKGKGIIRDKDLKKFKVKIRKVGIAIENGKAIAILDSEMSLPVKVVGTILDPVPAVGELVGNIIDLPFFDVKKTRVIIYRPIDTDFVVSPKGENVLRFSPHRDPKYKQEGKFGNFGTNMFRRQVYVEGHKTLDIPIPASIPIPNSNREIFFHVPRLDTVYSRQKNYLHMAIRPHVEEETPEFARSVKLGTATDETVAGKP